MQKIKDLKKNQTGPVRPNAANAEAAQKKVKEISFKIQQLINRTFSRQILSKEWRFTVAYSPDTTWTELQDWASNDPEKMLECRAINKGLVILDEEYKAMAWRFQNYELDQMAKVLKEIGEDTIEIKVLDFFKLLQDLEQVAPKHPLIRLFKEKDAAE